MSHKPEEDFLYLLRRKSDGFYIYVDDAGVLSYQVDPIAIVRTPEGWQKKSIVWERDIKRWGLVRSFTIPLEFVEDGAVMISKLALASYETELELLIKQLEFQDNGDGTHDWIYVDLYIGEPDLSKAEGSETRITAPMVEGGIAAQLKAFEDVVYEIPFDDYVSVKMDGAYLFFKKNFLTFDSSVNTFFALSQTPNNNETRNFVIGISQTVEEGTSFNIAGSDVSPVAIADNYDLTTMDEWFLSAYDTVQVTAHLKFLFTINKTPTGTGGSAVFKMVKSDGTVLQTFATASMSGSGFNQDYKIDTTITFTLNAGEKVFLIVELKSTTSVLHIGEPVIVKIYFAESTSEFTYKTKYHTTSCKAMRPFVLFQKLVEKITGSATNAESALLQAYPNICITSGDAVRGITGAVIKTSYSQFLQFCRTQFVAGDEISEGKIVIREMEDQASVATPIDLGEAKNFKWTFAQDLLFNLIKYGYQEEQIDDVNGKYSTHNTYSRTVGDHKKAKGTLEIICPYVADPYYIEILRINKEGKTTTDSTGDNKVVILNTEDSPDINYDGAFGNFFSANIITLIGGFPNKDLFQPGAQFTVSNSTSNNGTFTVIDSFKTGTNDLWIFVVEAVVAEALNPITISFGTVILKRITYIDLDIADTGVPDIASLYNLVFLSPKQILDRWMKYINSCLFQFPGTILKFQTTEKNRELRQNDGVTVIDEDEDVAVGTDRLFLAIYLTFDSLVPDLMPVTLQASPNVGFSTVWMGNPWLGILMRGGLAPNTMQEQSFKLLLGPDEDHTLLENS